MAEPAKYCRPTWYRDPLAVPRCTGHDEPMQWHKDARRKAGGRWHCAVKRRERDRKWRAANPEWAAVYRGPGGAGVAAQREYRAAYEARKRKAALIDKRNTLRKELEQ